MNEHIVISADIVHLIPNLELSERHGRTLVVTVLGHKGRTNVNEINQTVPLILWVPDVPENVDVIHFYSSSVPLDGHILLDHIKDSKIKIIWHIVTCPWTNALSNEIKVTIVDNMMVSECTLDEFAESILQFGVI